MMKIIPSESGEQITNKTINPNIGKKLVRDFLDVKLTWDKWVNFYNSGKWDGWIWALEEFREYYRKKSEGNIPDIKKIIDGIEKEYMYSELVRVGVAIESKRTTLTELLVREFNINSDQKKNLNKDIGSLSLSELTKCLNYRTSRATIIDRLFPDKEKRPTKQNFQKQFELIFENKKVVLNEDQKQNVARLLTSAHVSEQDIEWVSEYFKGKKEKQLLVKYFLPTITLKELQDLEIISEVAVREYIRKCVKKQFIGKTFSIDQDSIDDIDPDDIILPTRLLPELDLNKLLAGRWKQEIAKQIEAINQEAIKEFEEGNLLNLVPDENWELLPSFQQKLWELRIKNPESFKEGSYIRGKVKQPNGTFYTFHFAITSIDDNPVENKKNRGIGKEVTVKNILTGDNSTIDKNWKTKPGEEKFNYSDIYTLLKESKEGGTFEIVTEEMIEKKIESGEMIEKILREDINSLETLNDALDTIDSSGKKYPLQKGSSIQVGKPGEKGFWVFQVKSINPQNTGEEIAISDGTSQEILSYQEFFDNFESKKDITRLPNLETPEDFLKAIQEHSPKAKDFEKIIFNKDRWIFMPEDRKDDKDFPGILQFGGEKETITLHSNDASGLASWSAGEWDEKEKKYKSNAKGYKAGWNALYAQFLTLRATPKISDVPLTAPEQKDAHMHEHHGFFKHYMGNPSLHDMFNAAKGIVDFIKHKLEHGSKVHSAAFQLALGKKLGFNDAMMRELRNQVHGSTRELMEKMVKELTTLPAGERQTEVKHILENKGSHDYEIQAAILSMLKKHGTLYPGSLKPLEGSFAYFERLSGTKYGPNNPHVQRALREAWGNLFREEFLIQNYLQFIGGKAWWYQVDWNLWTEVNRSWLEGISSEKKAGEERAAPLPTLDGQLGWVYNKFAWGEYSNGIGAMKEVWKRWGPPHKMHEPAIYLALSNISTRLHGSQLDALKGEFYGGGHPYPALTALFTPEKLATFQQTVKILSEGNSDMKKAYKKIEDARSEDVGKTVEAIKNFWSAYGPELHKKLLISQDPEILYRAEHDTDPETREVLNSYVENYKGDTESMGPFNNDELWEWVYDYGHSGFTWSTDAYLKRTKVDRWPGTLWDDDGTKKIWKGYLESLDAIKWVSLPGDDEKEKREFQYQRFKEHHKSFYENIFDRSGADWADEDKNGIKKIAKQTYMIDLIKRWFRIPPWKDKDKLETPEYDHIAREDFETYMNGEKKTAQDEKETVATSISELLAK